MKEKKHGRQSRVLPFFAPLCLFLAGCGKDGGKYVFGSVDPKEIDPWVYIQDTALSASVPIRSFASSAGRLGMTIGVMGIVFSVMVMAIRIFLSGSAKTKSEIKEEALLKGLIAIMLFSVPLWLGICKMLSEVLV